MSTKNPTKKEIDAATKEAKAAIRKPRKITAYMNAFGEHGMELPPAGGGFGSMKDKSRFLAGLKVAENRAAQRRTKGMHMCQCCCKNNKVGNGVHHHLDGLEWADYLAHYVEAHNVKLPTEFVTYILTKFAPKEEPKSNNIDKLYVIEGVYQPEGTSAKKARYWRIIPYNSKYAIFTDKGHAIDVMGEFTYAEDFSSFHIGRDKCIDLRLKVVEPMGTSTDD